MKKKIAYTMLVIFMVLAIAGCNNLRFIGEQDNEHMYSREQYITAPHNEKPVNLAGWIVIRNGRLYLDEARVYIIGSDDPYDSYDPFRRHAGENIIIASQETFEQLGVEVLPSLMRVIPLESDIVSFELTDQTVYTFVDTAFFFTQELPPRYYTTHLTEFMMHFVLQWGSANRVYSSGHRLNCGYDVNVIMNTPEEYFSRTCKCANYRPPIVIIQVYNGRVISVTEEFLFTQ